ncbi:MAG: type II secretion system protein GspK, partial [Bacillota bacterium]|nr:type II secretion system protein GspK [Bacillota bacterium]
MARRALAEVRAREAAAAGVEAARALLAADTNGYDAPGEPWHNGGRPRRLALEGAAVEFRIADEGGLLNLNSAPAPVLAELPPLDPELLDALLDWRDVDADPRPAGAEEDYYQRLSTPYRPRQGLIPVREELRLIKGVAEVYGRLEPLVTTWGPLNVNVADLEAVDALLLARGVDPFQAQQAVNDLLLYRLGGGGGGSGNGGGNGGGSGAPRRVASLEELSKAIPSFSAEILERVQGALTTAGTVNVNTAPAEVLRAVCRGAGQGDAAAEALLRARAAHPLTGPEELAAVWGSPEVYRVLQDYLTVQSAYFTVTAR